MEGIRIKSLEKYFLLGLAVFVMIIFLFIIALIFFVSQGGEGIMTSLTQFYILLFAILVVLLVMLVFISMVFVIISSMNFGKTVRRDRLELSAEDIQDMSDDERSDLLQGLRADRDKIEYLIKLAETRYHTRKLDATSFREIVRDHQKKLMEIEAKMNEITGEVKKLGKKE